ncbi:MAG: DUF4230 domain-containing protein [Microthrixaceae bacterium]
MGVRRKQSSAVRRGGMAVGGGFMAVLVALACAVVLMLSGIIPVFGRSNTVDRTQTPVLQRIAKLNQFKAATGTFQVVVDIENDVEGLPSIIAGERTLLVAAGDVEAEVDFSGLKEDAIAIDEANNSVVVTVPPPTLTTARIDNSKTRVYSRERGLLNRLEDFVSDQPVDDQAIYVQAEDEMEAAAAASDLQGVARENTEDMLVAMLGSLGYDDVTVVFRTDTAGEGPNATPAEQTIDLGGAG